MPGLKEVSSKCSITQLKGYGEYPEGLALQREKSPLFLVCYVPWWSRTGASSGEQMMSWAESREFCKVLGGDLLTFTNVSQYAHIVQHLQRHELPSDFWIGSSFNNTTGWMWLDGSPMEMGSPYWASRYSPNCLSRNVTTAKSETRCYRYYQVPEEVPKGECVSLSFEHSFHMTDEDCLVKKSPLCIYEGLDFPKHPKF
ncbi:uncharacterized protein [Palaemon carinicauda]|uniref:uncharacterized protein n=1 Tax=Palaemon carinicauda TaxID=392227 RepID=UPI0035B68A21